MNNSYSQFSYNTNQSQFISPISKSKKNYTSQSNLKVSSNKQASSQMSTEKYRQIKKVMTSDPYNSIFSRLTNLKSLEDFVREGSNYIQFLQPQVNKYLPQQKYRKVRFSFKFKKTTPCCYLIRDYRFILCYYKLLIKQFPDKQMQLKQSIYRNYKQNIIDKQKFQKYFGNSIQNRLSYGLRSRSKKTKNVDSRNSKSVSSKKPSNQGISKRKSCNNIKSINKNKTKKEQKNPQATANKYNSLSENKNNFKLGAESALKNNIIKSTKRQTVTKFKGIQTQTQNYIQNKNKNLKSKNKSNSKNQQYQIQTNLQFQLNDFSLEIKKQQQQFNLNLNSSNHLKSEQNQNFQKPVQQIKNQSQSRNSQSDYLTKRRKTRQNIQSIQKTLDQIQNLTKTIQQINHQTIQQINHQQNMHSQQSKTQNIIENSNVQQRQLIPQNQPQVLLESQDQFLLVSQKQAQNSQNLFSLGENIQLNQTNNSIKQLPNEEQYLQKILMSKRKKVSRKKFNQDKTTQKQDQKTLNSPLKKTNRKTLTKIQFNQLINQNDAKDKLLIQKIDNLTKKMQSKEQQRLKQQLRSRQNILIIQKNFILWQNSIRRPLTNEQKNLLTKQENLILSYFPQINTIGKFDQFQIDKNCLLIYKDLNQVAGYNLQIVIAWPINLDQDAYKCLLLSKSDKNIDENQQIQNKQKLQRILKEENIQGINLVLIKK